MSCKYLYKLVGTNSCLAWYTWMKHMISTYRCLAWYTWMKQTLVVPIAVWHGILG